MWFIIKVRVRIFSITNSISITTDDKVIQWYGPCWEIPETLHWSGAELLSIRMPLFRKFKIQNKEVNLKRKFLCTRNMGFVIIKRNARKGIYTKNAKISTASKPRKSVIKDIPGSVKYMLVKEVVFSVKNVNTLICTKKVKLLLIKQRLKKELTSWNK